jgi:hypothetical protein
VVGEHKQEGDKRVKRQCGETHVDAKQFRDFNKKITGHVKRWTRRDRVASQAGASSPAKSKRKIKTTPGGGGGGKSKSSDPRKKPKRDPRPRRSKTPPGGRTLFAPRKSRPRPGTEDQHGHLPVAAKRARIHCSDD